MPNRFPLIWFNYFLYKERASACSDFCFSPSALVLLLRSQELERTSGLSPGWVYECDGTESLPSLQLFCDSTGVALGRKADKGLAGLQAAAVLGSVCGHESGKGLSSLLAPISPLCKDSAHFSCKISHTCKCLCQARVSDFGDVTVMDCGFCWRKWRDCWLVTGSKPQRGDMQSPLGCVFLPLGDTYPGASVWTLCLLRFP